ncbi:MAG: hypothetical protein PUB53_07130, partial [Bacteroidales bacterium]|nr:hypothetical protein [Bacteroidales bacterium]
RVSSCKNVFHTLSYRFDAIISLRLYSCGKGKGMNDCVQGGIADTLTKSQPKSGKVKNQEKSVNQNQEKSG